LGLGGAAFGLVVVAGLIVVASGSVVRAEARCYSKSRG
jgi:hypothetical protein